MQQILFLLLKKFQNPKRAQLLLSSKLCNSCRRTELSADVGRGAPGDPLASKKKIHLQLTVCHFSHDKKND